MGSFMARGNQYIQVVKVLYFKLPTNGKQLPTFPQKVWCHTMLLYVPQKSDLGNCINQQAKIYSPWKFMTDQNGT